MSTDLEDIPLYVKITLPTVVVVLAIIITCLVVRRHPGIFRKCRKKNKKQSPDDTEMRTVLSPNQQHTRRPSCGVRLLPPSPTGQNGELNTPSDFLLKHPPGEMEFETQRQVDGPDHGSGHTSGQFPPSCRLLDCDYGVENHLYASRVVSHDCNEHRSPCGCTEECSPDSQSPHARSPGNDASNVRVVDGICEPFVPGTKGYITMSSPNAPPVRRCRPKDGYITAHPEHRTWKPVNVCHPMTRSDEQLSDVKACAGERSFTSCDHHSDDKRHGSDDPEYERLDRYYRPGLRTKRTASLPSSKILQKRTALSAHRNHHDSLPLLPVELSFVEIPIGPFISMEKGEERMSETMDKIQNSESFENMFDGAWWHSESEHDVSAIGKDAPDLPSKHLRNKTSTLPYAYRQSGHRPTSAPYVTMNKGSRPGVGMRCSRGFTMVYPGRSVDSYMSHGQMMKMLQFYGVEDMAGQTSDRLPPPVPCAMHHEYVNANTARNKETI